MAALDWLQQLLGGGQYGDPSIPAMPTSPLEGNLYTGGALGQAGLPADGAKGYTADVLQHLKDVISGKVANEGVLGGAYQGDNRALDIAGGLVGAIKPIRAYHGSPHSFDRFDLSKIGTGEGAQAYGHGLYFAENEGVARGYRDDLGAGQAFNALDDFLKGNKGASLSPEEIGVRLRGTRAEPLAQDPQAIRAMRELLPNYDPSGAVSAGDLRNYRYLNDAVERLLPGHMYEVDIHADPKSFLDWDRPLAAQAPPVQQAMKSGLTDLNFTVPDEVVQLPNGRWAPMAEGKIYGRQDGWPDQGTARQVMGWSRQEAEKNAAKTAGDIMSRTYGGQNMEAKSAALREAGIPGIRYLDQGSRGAGTGTSNYAVFDDKLIEILRKYGILPPLAAGGLLGAAEE